MILVLKIYLYTRYNIKRWRKGQKQKNVKNIKKNWIKKKNEREL